MNEKILKVAAGLISAALITLSVSADKRVMAADSSGIINIDYPTAEEISEYMSEHPFDTNLLSEYTSAPDYQNAPYAPGKLSDKTLENALNAFNMVRFIAGLDEVELSDEYNELAQAGALVNAVNNKLSHTPDKPAGMSDELYQMGYNGTSQSNLSWASYKSSIAARLLYGWMSDSDDYNIDCLGHRRWCLNPSMEKTGFGNVGNYHDMYSFDNWYAPTDVRGVCWPAPIMPEGFFADDDPWSISVGYSVSIDDVEVTLTRKNDGAKWNFSANSSDGYFNVDNAGYGQKGCIIFRPKNIEYNPGDSFEVNIPGLASYTVDFVDLSAVENTVTLSNLIELNNFLVNRDFKADEVADLNGDGVINVFDSIYARRSLLK